MLRRLRKLQNELGVFQDLATHARLLGLLRPETAASPAAGELITQFTLAMQNGIGLGAFTNVIYPYPTQGEALKRAAGAYTRTRLTPAVKRLFERWLAFRR